jgi:hypothetical protein
LYLSSFPLFEEEALLLFPEKPENELRNVAAVSIKPAFAMKSLRSIFLFFKN